MQGLFTVWILCTHTASVPPSGWPVTLHSKWRVVRVVLTG